MAVTPESFGADGTSQGDTRAVIAALEHMAGAGERELRFASRTYRFKPESEPRWIFPPTPLKVYSAVPLPNSDVAFKGDGTVFVMEPPDVVSAENIFNYYYFFSTAFNMTIGAQKNISFDGITFDGDNTIFAVNRVLHLGMFIGVENLTIGNCVFKNSQGNLMRGGSYMNCRNLLFENNDYLNVTQGFWAQYIDKLTVRNLRFDGFIEAIDIDEVCWDVTISDCVFKNGVRQSQAIDSTAIQGGLITNIRCENVAKLIWLYDKRHSWPTFAEFVNASAHDTPTAVASHDVTVRGLRAVGGGVAFQDAIRIANQRKSGDAVSKIIHDVTLEDIDMQGTGGIKVNEGVKITLKNIVMRDVVMNNDGKEKAALTVMQSNADNIARAASKIEATVRDVTIERPQGTGFLTWNPGDVDIDGLTIRDYNTAGYEGAAGLLARGLRRKPNGLLRLNNVDIGTSHGEGSPTDLRLTTEGADAGCAVRYGRVRLRSDVRGSRRIAIAGPYPLSHESGPVWTFALPDLDLTAGKGERSITVVVEAPANGPLLIDYPRLVCAAGLAGDPDNHGFVVLKRAGPSGPANVTKALVIGDAPVAAGGELEFVMKPGDQAALLQPGDALIATFAQVGAGCLLRGLWLVFMPLIGH